MEYEDCDEFKTTTGLSNIGNTCFMNSALQLLTHCDILTCFIKDNRLNKNLSSCYQDFLEEYDSAKKYFSPRDLKNTIGDKFKIFRGYGQQDSHEFMIYLLDNLHEALSCEIEYNINGNIINDRDRIMKESFKEWVDFIKRGDSVISQHFFGQFHKNIYSKDDNKLLSPTYQTFNHLTIPINEDSETIYDCLDNFFALFLFLSNK